MVMREGSLFSGYGGLSGAVERFFGAETAWVSDVDKGANKVLAHRYPGVPNLGDITAVDWSQVEPVDIVTGGSPCQDLSHAGKRGGMTEGTRSNLWVSMRDAIAQLRPTYVVWENVRGAYSAEADSDLGPCPGCLDDPRQRGPVLRALGRVLGDLSDLGYDCRWHGLRAADVGAAHGRFRVFVVATDTRSSRRDGWTGTFGAAGRDEPANGRLLPTPSVADAIGGHLNRSGDRSGELLLPGVAKQLGRLLPTPAVNDMGAGKTVEAWDDWTATQKAKHGNGNGHGPSLHIEALRLLPTNVTLTDATVRERIPWGEYVDAIARQEAVFGRQAPPPTETAPRGGQRLSCRFDEWLMGLPDGWVTDVPSITHNEALKLCGNGVVWQQAYAALTFMLGAQAVAA